MKQAFIAILVIALGLSWLWFWTVLEAPDSGSGGDKQILASDMVSVWINELIGSPDEAHYYQLAGLWNASHPDVHIKMAVMSHSGYQSKLRVALATGQPPDVYLSGYADIDTLQYSGKVSDLSVPIPEAFLPDAALEGMGPLVRRAITRDGRPTAFPIYRYAYGGVILANRGMLTAAGYDDAAVRENGWTVDAFRDACKRMTRDSDGDGNIDTWGFGAALIHVQQLFIDEFGPGIWGRDVSLRHFLYLEPPSQEWKLHPGLTEDKVAEVFALFDHLLNIDKSWNPATLGMNWNEINEELITRRTLGMTFGESPWSAKLWRETWEADHARGATQGDEPPDLTVIWMPTRESGTWPAPRAGVLGFSVLKQIPYKGDAHTENALRVAKFLSDPAHLARSQLRRFRHLPPDTRAFAQLFPELVPTDDPWVQFYTKVMESEIPVVEEPLSPGDPATARYAVLRLAIDRWFEKEGKGYIEQVIYHRLTPRDAAKQFMEGLRAAVTAATQSLPDTEEDSSRRDAETQRKES
ncbi:MAG: carbohydrate ABC transporter substrate-binding protein [Candidatus Hydrogenedentes bacterium]|nr:carbohydrate ABC transporter substrate-binding protein [Candidatus Hydrogenedentota bacterium]